MCVQDAEEAMEEAAKIPVAVPGPFSPSLSVTHVENDSPFVGSSDRVDNGSSSPVSALIY